MDDIYAFNLNRRNNCYSRRFLSEEYKLTLLPILTYWPLESVNVKKSTDPSSLKMPL